MMQYCMHSCRQNPESDVLLHCYLVNLKYLKQILSMYLRSVKIIGTYGSVPFYAILYFILEAEFCDNILTL